MLRITYPCDAAISLTGVMRRGYLYIFSLPYQFMFPLNQRTHVGMLITAAASTQIDKAHIDRGLSSTEK